jgi:hypothetical protein
MQEVKLKKFVDAVNAVEDNDDVITYYNLKKNDTGLSNEFLLKCLKFCVHFGMLKMRIKRVNQRVTHVYTKRLTWVLLERYLNSVLEK